MNLQFSQSFDATGARMASTIDTATGTPTAVSASSTGFGGGVSIDYDAATGGYTVHDATGGSQTFLPSDKDISATGSNAVVSVYGKTAGNRTDQLVLFNPGPGNTQLALTYVSYGAWQTIVDNTTSVDANQQFFVFGIREAANAPSTGSASYVTRPDGFWTNPGGVYSLSGTSTFTADWNAMTVSTSLDLTGTNIVDSTTKRLGLFNGSGSIAALGGGFSGTFAHQGTDADGNVYNGNFAGAFFGPAGQEVGYTFSLVGPGGAAVGAVVGKAN